MLTFRSLAVIVSSLLLLNSCKSKKPEVNIPEDTSVSIPELRNNNLGQAQNPSSFLLEQAHSPIHWQPWNKEVFANAAKEKKTVFAFIGSSTNSHSLETLKQINTSPTSIAILNKSHVNIILDTDQYPELSYLISFFSGQMKQAVSPTQLVWFSYEGLPLSWVSIHANSQFNINESLGNMSETVSNLWKSDPSYVISNSITDLESRLDAMSPKSKGKTDPLITSRTTRQAASLFDPISNNIDYRTNITTGRYIRLMTLAAAHPDTTEQQQNNYTKIATLTAEKILFKGLIDPLDGGIFVNMKHSESKLPVFTKTLSTQTWSMAALYSLYQLTSDRKYLTAAENISQYIENSLTLPEGDYSLGIIYARHGLMDNPCLWTLEEVEAALNQEEAQLCVQAFGMSGTGNVSLIDNPNGTYFRKNTLIWQHSFEELASRTNMPRAELQTKLDSATRKLAKLRKEKNQHIHKNKLSTASNTAALVSAYLVGYRATGDTAKLEKAQQILNFIRSHFITQSGILQRCRFQGKLQEIPANGIDYARVCSAALDLHEATLDPTWLDFATEIHQQMNAKLADTELTNLIETDGSMHPHHFKVPKCITIKQIDNESTWSLVYANAKRLSMRGKGEKTALQASNLRNKINGIILNAPLASIDYLTHTALLGSKIVYLKAPVDQKLFKAALPLHCQLILAPDDNNLPNTHEAISKLKPGQALVMESDNVIGTAENTETLLQLLH